MKLYADLAPQRFSQIAADLFLAAWTYLWIRLAMALHDVIQVLARPGRALEDAGARFGEFVSGAGEDVSGVPLFGEDLQVPFDRLADAGAILREAGQSQQDAVANVALWVSVLVGLIPIVLMLTRWLPWRLGWVVEATAAQDLARGSDDLRLFALRALARRSVRELRSASADPAGDYEAGRYEALAALELGTLGLRERRQET